MKERWFIFKSPGWWMPKGNIKTIDGHYINTIWTCKCLHHLTNEQLAVAAIDLLSKCNHNN